MKTNQLIACATAVIAVMFIVILVLFSRQSSLEDELARLHAAIESRSTATGSSQPSTPVVESPGFDNRRIGVVEPFASEDPLTDAITRLTDLERIVNSQADFIEDLLAEHTRAAEARRKASMRAWGPEQAVGEPDTMTAGDHQTAWAPATADGGIQWFEATFENPADLAKIVVRQTSNPGTITKVVALTATGAEVPIWTGEDPSKGQALADTPFAVPGGITANRVKIYMDTSKIPGWEEIDAVQILGRDGKAQWAKSTNASSTYASGSRERLYTSDFNNAILTNFGLEPESTSSDLSR